MHTKASSDNTGCFARKTVIVQKKVLAWVDLAITVLFFSYVRVLYPLATQVTADPKEN